LLASPLLAPAMTGARGGWALDTLVRHEESRLSMGCAFSLVAHGRDAEHLREAADDAFAEADRIDRLMSHYRRDSPLSLVNREAAERPVEVDAELFDFLDLCLRYGRESEGAFDVTVGPLMRAWGFFLGAERVPGPDEIEALRVRVGYRNLLLDPLRRTVRFARPGVELDLGGIAKGYAIERMADILRRHDVAAALLSSGGSTLYAIGAPPGASAWEVKVEDPLGQGRIALTFPLRDEALSIAGSRDKSFERDGVVYSHIMDPRLGRPVQGVAVVAVRTASPTAGDALDNAFFVLGVAGTRTYLEHLPPTEAVLFLPAAGGGFETVRLRN
jgi:thiamine biosynthesis lipoprotein